MLHYKVIVHVNYKPYYALSSRTPVTASLQTASSTLYFHNPLFSSLRAGI